MGGIDDNVLKGFELGAGDIGVVRLSHLRTDDFRSVLDVALDTESVVVMMMRRLCNVSKAHQSSN